MNWKVILAALALIKELISYLSERKKCDCSKTKVHELKTITQEIAKARKEDKELNIKV